MNQKKQKVRIKKGENMFILPNVKMNELERIKFWAIYEKNLE